MTVTTAAVPVADLSGTVTFDGAELPTAVSDLLRSFRVERGVRTVGRAELTFTDTDFALLTERSSLFKVGAAVAVSASYQGQSTKIFDGLVTGVRTDYVAAAWGSPPVLTVVVEEPTSELRQNQQTTVLTDVTLSDVLSQVCAVGGLSVSAAGLPTAVHPTYLVTTSPLALLENVCDTYGVEWWLEGKTLHVGAAESTGQLDLALTSMVATLSLETVNAGTGTVTVRGWDPAEKQAVVGTQSGEVTDAAAALGSQTLENLMGTPPARSVDTRARGMVGQSDLEAHAEGISLAAARQRHAVQIETILMLPQLAPRTSLHLKEAGGLTGKYRASAVVHTWDANGGRSKVFCGPRASVALAPALSSMAPAPSVAGMLLVGLVTDISPTESTDAGCVKVKFPTLGDNVASAWARVLRTGAGKDRGFVVPHQVNDEVIVGFEEGDLQRPVVLGAVHGGQAAPPSATAVAEGKAPTAGLTSANGHVVLVTDEEDKAKNGVLVKHVKGSSVLLNDQGITVEGKTVPVTVKVGSASVVVDEKGNVTLKGTKVVLEGTAEVEIKAPQVKVAATGQLDMSASGSAALKAQGEVEVSSSGITQVKGSLVKIN